MQFRENAGVFTASGDHVGNVARVVMTPGSRRITHLVIRQGFLFTEDKVLPVSMIDQANEDKVVLRSDVGDLDTLPQYQEEHFTIVDERDADYYSAGNAVPVYPYMPIGTWGAYYPATWADTPPYVSYTVENIPDGTIALKTGAKVYSSDDQHVGNVERVEMDEVTRRATHFIIAQGLFFKDRKVIPTTWIDKVQHDAIFLSVTARYLEGLPDYMEEPV